MDTILANALLAKLSLVAIAINYGHKHKHNIWTDLWFKKCR